MAETFQVGDVVRQRVGTHWGRILSIEGQKMRVEFYFPRIHILEYFTDGQFSKTCDLAEWDLTKESR